MVPMLLRFVAGARAAGLRISTSEVLDCLQHLERVDPLEETQFKSVLQTNFAKSHREQVHFERLYRLFFHELRQDLSIARSPYLAEPLRALIESLRVEAGDRSRQALLEFLAGDPAGWLEELAADGGPPSSSAAGGGASASRREDLGRSIRMLAGQLTAALAGRREELGWEERRDLSEHFQDRLEAARRLLAHPPEEPRPIQERRRSYRHVADEMGDVHFAALTSREVEAMREAIEQLVRKLRDRIHRRHAVRRRGALDVKKTLRAAAYQGLPFELRYRRRPPRKAKVVTLCDVSGSVWSAARFMLNMLYALQDCLAQVRSFIFVAGTEEVTDVFKRYPINSESAAGVHHRARAIKERVHAFQGSKTQLGVRTWAPNNTAKAGLSRGVSAAIGRSSAAGGRWIKRNPPWSSYMARGSPLFCGRPRWKVFPSAPTPSHSTCPVTAGAAAAAGRRFRTMHP